MELLNTWEFRAFACIAVLLIAFVPVIQRKRLTSEVCAEKQAELENAYRNTIMKMIGGAAILIGGVYSFTELGLRREQFESDSFDKALADLQTDNPIRSKSAILRIERLAQGDNEVAEIAVEVLSGIVRRRAEQRQYEAFKQMTEIIVDETSDWDFKDRAKARTDLLRYARFLSMPERYDFSPYPVLGDEGYSDQKTEVREAFKAIWDRLSHLFHADCFSCLGRNVVVDSDAITALESLGRISRLRDTPVMLSGITVQGAFLKECSFREGSFEHSTFSGCDFNEADLADASFEYSRIQSSSFADADLSNASFEGATLIHVDMRRASVTAEQLSQVLEFHHVNVSVPIPIEMAERVTVERIESDCWVINSIREDDDLELPYPDARAPPSEDAPVPSV